MHNETNINMGNWKYGDKQPEIATERPTHGHGHTDGVTIRQRLESQPKITRKTPPTLAIPSADACEVEIIILVKWLLLSEDDNF